MLDLSSIDLRDLAEALEDHGWEHAWWFVPSTGAVEMTFEDPGLTNDSDFDPEESKATRIEALPSGVGYGDMEDFIARVRDPKAGRELERAIAGRGAFRRFKDVLFDYPDLREVWFRFHDARMTRRAIDWLRSNSVIDEQAAERLLAEAGDPDLPEIAGPFDADAIGAAVAEDLKGLYGERLRQVVLFGSWARGDAHPESDIDLLVVLDVVGNWAEELQRMGPILDRHSDANETVVSALVVSEDEAGRRASPTLIRAMSEGRPIAFRASGGASARRG